MKKVRLVLMLVLALILAGVIGARLALSRHPSPIAGATPITEYGTLKEFSLTDQNGNTFNSSSMKGSVWIADFVFTRCMGPCPLVTSKMIQWQKEFPSSTGLKFMTFSVDPEYDTPAILKKYATSYQADESRWTFLTGDHKKVYGIIRDNFHLVVEPGASETDIIHSLHHVLIDKSGTILGYFNSADSADVEQLKTRLKKIL